LCLFQEEEVDAGQGREEGWDAGEG